MIFVIRKNDLKTVGVFDTLNLAKDYIHDKEHDTDYYFCEELSNVNYISRITHVDGKCIYNNVEFWSKTAQEIFTNFNEHTVVDILGQQVNAYRFKTELYSNKNRINQIDGRTGQIMYNMAVGQEFVSLFREECILANFTNAANTSPMIIFEKLTEVIIMLNAGAFREAKLYLQGYREKLKDDFLTDERINKYIDMLDSADSIAYATDEEYFYTVPEAKI